MASTLKPAKKMMILRLLCEGNSIRSTERITGVQGFDRPHDTGLKGALMESTKQANRMRRAVADQVAVSRHPVLLGELYRGVQAKHGPVDTGPVPRRPA